MEYELLDTGVFEGDRYFDVFVEYAKAGPENILVRITATRREVAHRIPFPTQFPCEDARGPTPCRASGL